MGTMGKQIDARFNEFNGNRMKKSEVELPPIHVIRGNDKPWDFLG
jgi:hypothetical protein